MTNYNERLDELMPCDCKFLRGFAWRKGDPCEGCINGRLKQAITSLIKELVEEAKPEQQKIENMGDTFKADWARGYNVATDRFEQNLLKALEEL
jgi:hypothetical protein